MPRDKRTLDLTTVVQAATALVDEQGFEALTLGSLAAALGVKPPSLYNHVSGIDDVRRRVAQAVADRMSNAIRNAAVGRSEDDALRDLASAYRHFATSQRELYRAFLATPSSGNDTPFDVVSTTLKQVLAAYHLSAKAENDFIRILHSALYGFVALEIAGVFAHASDIDDSFTVLVDAQISILHGFKGAQS